MIRNIKLIVAYDGTRYRGWQDSIETAIRNVLEMICRHEIYLQAAGRTDAGVHAHGQVVNFMTSKDLNPGRLQCSLNQLLPKDIVVKSAEFASETFHPTLDAKGKEYLYYLCIGKFQLPEHRLYSWFVPQKLDREAMESAARILSGKQDFASFCNHRPVHRYSDFVREVSSITFRECGTDRLCISVQGNHFLYRMVRNLVGTLVYIGRGKLALSDLRAILDAGERSAAGICAPAHGLFLHEVFY